MRRIKADSEVTVEKLQLEERKLKLIISKLVKPDKGPKSKMCRHFDSVTNSADSCPNGSKCTFVHNLFELIKT